MKYLIGNWKINLTLKESIGLANKLTKETKERNKNLIMALCPSFVSLSEVSKIIKKSPIVLGAQDVFWEERGAFTGEVSVRELKELGVQYVIIGHSERRHVTGESDETVARKMQQALHSSLRPILCVGETLAERNNGVAERVVGHQLRTVFENISEASARKILIAYEPVWAIGTGTPCTPDDALSMLVLIRKMIAEKFGDVKVPILYGGSTDNRNVALYAEVGFDGALVGGSSLKATTFLQMKDQLLA
ncbi:MAG TPA: triose-phosphate isomerase [Patescibacteria group bacterium]|nr:triose-phosphate isomerase [Patescibacteria group bacterium]